MKRFIILLCGMFCVQSSIALSGKDYLERFNTYQAYSQQLPFTPTPTFLEFVKGSSPLSNKLRDRWLYELARTKSWQSYTQYYQPTNDINLVCFAQIAKYNLGAQQEALQGAIPVWLSAESMPQSCSSLFDMLLKDGRIDQNLINQRIAIALEKNKISLARYLMTLYKTPHRADIDALNKIYQNPNNISTLNSGNLSGEIYLYGLKRIFASNVEKSLKIWHNSKTQNILSPAQKQAFLSHVALYKAMRNNDDTPYWFAKVKPEFYSELLLDWQIRFAIKHRNWTKVAKLINKASNKDTPCWQYWLGRSFEEQGKKEEARAVYEPLAKNRHYYGFLASMRLQKKPNFSNEEPIKNITLLNPYREIIEQIKTFYQKKDIVHASRLLNDFISELPKDEASALVYWVDSHLQWHGKSILLSNNDSLNNQLSLRFPLAHQQVVTQYAKKYTLSPEFVYAIIRQESSFREDATSAVGARGLMQLMPNTAKLVSKTEKINYQHQNQLYLSEKNINLGTAYLKQLSKRFSNHPILIAAAYNAGPRQVVNWLSDPAAKDIDIWIETLPWQETRNYLKNIMAFYVVYQYRLKQKPNMEFILKPL